MNQQGYSSAQLTADQCTPQRSGMYAGHCFHEVQPPQVEGGGLSSRSMICCHCGRHAQLSTVQPIPIWHGPHAPKR